MINNKMSSENITEYFLLVPVKIDLKEGKVIGTEPITNEVATEIFNTAGFFTSREDAVSYLVDEDDTLVRPDPDKDQPEFCAACEVSFEDYPEMRTEGDKCSTCSKG
jgi:hypothetical protein